MIKYPKRLSIRSQDSEQYQMLVKMALQHLWQGNSEQAFTILSHIEPVQFDLKLIELCRLSKKLQLSQTDVLTIINQIQSPTLTALAVVDSLNTWTDQGNSTQSELLDLAEQFLRDLSGDLSTYVDQARTAIDVEHFDFAYELLWNIVRYDEYNEEAWYLLSTITNADDVRETCLKNVLSINPDNQQAKTELAKLNEQHGRAFSDESISKRFGTAEYEFEDDDVLFFNIPPDGKPKIKRLTLDGSLLTYLIAEFARHLLINQRIDSVRPFASVDNDNLLVNLALGTLKVVEQHFANISYDKVITKKLIEDAVSIAERVSDSRQAPLTALCCQFLNYLEPAQAETLFLSVYDEWKTHESTQIGLECGFISVLPYLEHWWVKTQEVARSKKARPNSPFDAAPTSPQLDVSGFVSSDKVGQIIKFVSGLDNVELQRFMYEALDNAVKYDFEKSQPKVPTSEDEPSDISAIELLGRSGVVIDKEMISVLHNTGELLALMDAQLISALEDIEEDDSFDDFGDDLFG